MECKWTNERNNHSESNNKHHLHSNSDRIEWMYSDRIGLSDGDTIAIIRLDGTDRDMYRRICSVQCESSSSRSDIYMEF